MSEPTRAPVLACCTSGNTERATSMTFRTPYSPDLNPTEKACAKIKTILRKTSAHTREALSRPSAKQSRFLQDRMPQIFPRGRLSNLIGNRSKLSRNTVNSAPSRQS